MGGFLTMKLLTDNLWPHLGAVVAVAIGLVDVWHFHTFGTTADQIFIIGGLAAFGVNLAAPQNK